MKLNTRRFMVATPESLPKKKYKVEGDGFYQYKRQNLEAFETVLIMIDVWQDHPNEGFIERSQSHIEHKIVPLVDTARSKGILVAYALHGRELHKALSIQERDVVLHVSAVSHLTNFLEARRIKNILYAGYHTNMCILFRTCGIVTAHTYYPQGNIILVRDCVLAFENAETLQGQWCNRVAVNMVETALGSSTTLDDLREA